MNWRSTSWTISAAAKPTDFMVMALNQYGKLAPTNKAANVRGVSTFTPVVIPKRTTKAPYKANETKAALPMAKPLPIAAVVLPALRGEVC